MSQRLPVQVDDVASHLRARSFPEVASALRSGTDSILRRWRARSLEAMPHLDALTIVEFEDSMGAILDAIAAAMESDDPVLLRRVIAQAPLHGVDRFLRKFSLDLLLSEERVLRAAIIVDLREQMGRALTESEAAALHELIDLMIEHSVIALIRRRTQEHDETMQHRMAGMQRLADMGTLVAGVAHDAANLLLPLIMSIDRLKHIDLPAEARSNVQLIEQVFHHFQNTIVNLRWLSVDASHRHAAAQALDLRAFLEDFEQFQRTMLPKAIALECDVPEGLPKVRISQAALSQALFNLIRNAQQAILVRRESGRISVRARAGPGDSVEVLVEDDGPGMSPEVLARCMDPLFTTRDAGSGLGLALVQALVEGAGGHVHVESPPRGKSQGTLLVVSLVPWTSGSEHLAASGD